MARVPMTEGEASASESETGARRITRRAADRLGRDGRDALRRTVESAVIPAMAGRPKPKKQNRWPDRVREVALLCLAEDDQAVGTYVAALHRAGEPVEALYEMLLTPTARHLGVMWDQDECSFADMTIGIMRLQRAQRDLSPAFRGDNLPVPNRRILLMPVPGEQHLFGLSIVADFFINAGWDAKVAAPGTLRDARRLVRGWRADLVGLTLGCEDRVAEAAALIVALRRDVPGIRVLAGGPSVIDRPALVAEIGADAGAESAPQAVAWAATMLGVPARG